LKGTASAVPPEPAKYAALAAEGRVPEAAQVAIKNLIRVSLGQSLSSVTSNRCTEGLMSDNDYVLANVREAFKAAFDINPQLVSMETTASDISAWDSVGHLSLAGNLEEVFGISLDVDELMEMESVREIVRIIEAKLPKKV
jgi:acyl carrier protein